MVLVLVCVAFVCVLLHKVCVIWYLCSYVWLLCVCFCIRFVLYTVLVLVYMACVCVCVCSYVRLLCLCAFASGLCVVCMHEAMRLQTLFVASKCMMHVTYTYTHT